MHSYKSDGRERRDPCRPSGSHFERSWDIHVDESHPLCTMRDADGTVYSCVRRVANGGDSGFDRYYFPPGCA